MTSRQLIRVCRKAGSPIRRLSIEALEPRLALADTALPYAGMTAFNQMQPYPGVGVAVDGSHGPNGNRWSIAILDTGIDLDHPFFVRNSVVNGVAGMASPKVAARATA